MNRRCRRCSQWISTVTNGIDILISSSNNLARWIWIYISHCLSVHSFSICISCRVSVTGEEELSHDPLESWSALWRWYSRDSGRGRPNNSWRWYNTYLFYSNGSKVVAMTKKMFFECARTKTTQNTVSLKQVNPIIGECECEYASLLHYWFVPPSSQQTTLLWEL